MTVGRLFFPAHDETEVESRLSAEETFSDEDETIDLGDEYPESDEDENSDEDVDSESDSDKDETSNWYDELESDEYGEWYGDEYALKAFSSRYLPVRHDDQQRNRSRRGYCEISWKKSAKARKGWGRHRRRIQRNLQRPEHSRAAANLTELDWQFGLDQVRLAIAIARAHVI